MSETEQQQLTPEQQEFLAQCEKDFANRYTEKDNDFTIVMQIGVSPPPLVEPWRPKGNQNFRNDDNRKHHMPSDHHHTQKRPRWR